MKYEIYVTGSSWGGSQVRCKSVSDCRKVFIATANEIGRHADRSTAVGTVTVGDCVSHRFTIGPRGGIRKEAC